MMFEDLFIGLDIAALVLAGSLVWLISSVPRPKPTTGLRAALVEGINYMRKDRLLLRLAIALGVANFLATATLTVQVLFAQAKVTLHTHPAPCVCMSGSLFVSVVCRCAAPRPHHNCDTVPSPPPPRSWCLKFQSSGAGGFTSIVHACRST